MRTTLVWLERDLRLRDNPALAAAAKRGRVLPLFVLEPPDTTAWSAGAARRWWLHQSLAALQQDLAKLDCPLLLLQGTALEMLQAAVGASGADAVYWNRRYEPALVQRDTAIKSALREQGLEARSFSSQLLFEPTQVATGSGGPYRVFTPFWKSIRDRVDDSLPLPAPRLRAAEMPSRNKLQARSLEELELLPHIDWAGGMRDTWTPGEAGARKSLSTFARKSVASYDVQRDLPGITGTSRLSPHLHHGELSPRQVWSFLQQQVETGKHTEADIEPYLRQIGWREFAHHLLFHFPATPDAALLTQYERFPWRRAPKQLRTWQKGRTGYPIVDAGMRELWHTGWMHNRVRMIVASFLVKDLLLDWRHGARWFWDTLVDADLANNTLGWQWAAGCGADAAPYFRVFNPVLQGRKFDPEGTYVRRWVPELAAVPDRWLHAPWEAPPLELSAAGITLGRTYPHPMIDHKEARLRALDALATLKQR